MTTKPESRLHRRIKLAIKKEFGGVFWKIHGGPYQAAGIPDLVGCIDGFFVSVEVKIPGRTQKPSQIQQATINKIKKSGGIAIVVNSPDRAVEILRWRLNGKFNHTRLYSIWSNMIQRCTNESHKNYKWYGGRGISVCEPWQNGVFYFWRDMGFPPDGLELDRIDNNGNYQPDNCQWITHKENCNK